MTGRSNVTVEAGGCAREQNKAAIRSFVRLCTLALMVAATLPLSARADTTAVRETRSEKEPDKVDWLVLAPDVGYRFLHVRKVEFEKNADTPKLIPTSTQAVATGLSLGVRLWFLSLLLRPEVAFFNGTRGEAFDNSFRLWSFDLEFQFRAPLGRFQPYMFAGGGYSAMGALSDVIDGGRREANARGGNVRGGLGFDVFLGDAWTLGFRAAVEGVFLSSKVPLKKLLMAEQVDTIGQAEDRARDADGFISGLSPSVAGSLGVRF